MSWNGRPQNQPPWASAPWFAAFADTVNNNGNGNGSGIGVDQMNFNDMPWWTPHNQHHHHHGGRPSFPFAPFMAGGGHRGPGPWAWGPHRSGGCPPRGRNNTTRARNDGPSSNRNNPEPGTVPGPSGTQPGNNPVPETQTPPGDNPTQEPPRPSTTRAGDAPPPPYNEDSIPHPLAQVLSGLAETIFPGSTTNNPGRHTDRQSSTPSSYTPPLDLFATPTAYILHFALPGAKKEDIGLDWDSDNSTLRVAGVVHRPGDETLLASLVPNFSERAVGYFERVVDLPPAGAEGRRSRRTKQGVRVDVDPEEEKKKSDEEEEGEEGKEEIDAAGITARMEDGVLIVTVPKVERGWTEVTKVDIE